MLSISRSWTRSKQKEPELAARLVAEHIERFYEDQVLERPRVPGWSMTRKVRPLEWPAITFQSMASPKGGAL